MLHPSACSTSQLDTNASLPCYHNAPDARPLLWELLFDTQPPGSSSFDCTSVSPASEQTLTWTPDFPSKKDKERRICLEPKGENKVVLVWCRTVWILNIQDHSMSVYGRCKPMNIPWVSNWLVLVDRIIFKRLLNLKFKLWILHWLQYQ